MQLVTITTSDGPCPAYVARPGGTGPWPAVLVYMDGLGIRPAMFALGDRLATYGYLVLLPDLFWRAGAYPPASESMLHDPEERKVLAGRTQTATPANVMQDTEAFLAWFGAQPDVKAGRIGVTGYCMGGAQALRAAGAFPDRIAAAASYHGGNLAVDAPDSPHVLAAQSRARIYVACATDDQWFPDAQKDRLAAALAGVDHKIETYPAKHGWVLSDTSAYDEASAERHWHTLSALLEATLRG